MLWYVNALSVNCANIYKFYSKKVGDKYVNAVCLKGHGSHGCGYILT
jgi:hypothetical protein